MDKPVVDWFALSPSLALLAAAGLALLGAVLVPRAAVRIFSACRTEWSLSASSMFSRTANWTASNDEAVGAASHSTSPDN